ncbi:MAG: ABC transporter substrate-binding protein [Clostridia bacterium]|nr:ABC transporter substrate-binding protein [Clostridia bacterium]
MKRTILIVLALALALLPLACGTNAPKETVTLELHEVTRSVFYAPQYIALSLGYFEDEGLHVEITTSGGSEKAMTALLSGEADLCLAGPETGVYVMNEGKADHPVIVGQLTKRDGSFLIAREPAEHFSWDDLKGKTIIGGRAGGMPIMTLRWVMANNGLIDGENCTIIDSIQFNLMAGAFEGGEGDYVTLFEPTATEFQKAGKGYIVANIGLESGEVPYTCYFASQKMIEEHPERIEAFLRAIFRAQQWIETASDEDAAKAMQPYFPDASLDSLKAVVKSYRETDSWKKDPILQEADYERLLAIIDFNGELSGRPDFSELVNNTFAKKVSGQ